ncbi:MAG: aspartate-semialdehyde dehydrogenase, partial [Rickettsiales bacterium]|nr:aspartate-semialdehyde dehydrogenase [Rickettsiales bacterium]
NVAVVGATGNVGREMLDVLAQRNFPVNNVYAVASSRSVGREVSFGDDQTLKVQDLEYFDFSKCDIALFSPGAAVSKIHAPRAGKSGCVVIDNTSQFRMDKNIPLVVPEVNPQDIPKYKETGIIANPNCSTIQMVVALKPLTKLGKIKRVIVSTYQSVSGAGKEAMDELYHQTKGVYVSDLKEPEKFTKRIAFNVIPHIDKFMEGEFEGYTKEEWKMTVETKKIMGDDDIQVTATCVRVPVFVSHSEAINVEFDREISVADVRKVLEKAEGIEVVDTHENGGYMTPYEAAGKDATYVSRIRKDVTNPKAINMWVVSDNIRKGAALNSVQIAEVLIRDYLK